MNQYAQLSEMSFNLIYDFVRQGERSVGHKEIGRHFKSLIGTNIEDHMTGAGLGAEESRVYDMIQEELDCTTLNILAEQNRDNVYSVAQKRLYTR